MMSEYKTEEHLDLQLKTLATGLDPHIHAKVQFMTLGLLNNLQNIKL